MSPAGQPNGSPRRRKITRQTPIEPTLQTKLGALGSTVAAKKNRDFDPQAFLATISEGRKFVLFPRKQSIFAQGDAADAVFYLQTGKVKLTVVSKSGKEATIGILGEGDFFGEGCLAGLLFLRFRTYSQASTAMIRITTTASTISFGSIRFRFIESSLHPECPQTNFTHKAPSGIRTL